MKSNFLLLLSMVMIYPYIISAIAINKSEDATSPRQDAV